MKTKEIIKNVCVYLGKEELLNSSFFEENGAEEFFSHEIGVEWVGEHSFDYYCS